MCDSTFAFGQRGSHFFQCPSRREYTRLPRKLSNILNSTQLTQIYHVCLGHEDTFLLTWRDGHGKDHIDSSGLPQELTSFLYARSPQGTLLRTIPSIRCVLGPYNSSYFVHDSSAYAWMNLPNPLLAALQSNIQNGAWTDRPRVLSLGAKQDFVLLTEQHAAVWNLEHYSAVRTYLETAHVQTDRVRVRAIQQIALHPHRFQSSIMLTADGALVSDNLPPPAVAGFQAMLAPVLRDTKGTRQTLLARAKSEVSASALRRPSMLQQRAQMRREWNEHGHEFTAQAKGMKVSLSLNIRLAGFSKMLG